MPNPTHTAADAVRETIEQNGIIRNGLSMGLINARALARYIQASSSEDLSFDAILGAIRRYPVRESASRRLRVGQMISRIAMKNDMGDLALRSTPGLSLMIAKFYEEIDYAGGESLRTISKGGVVRVVTDAKNMKKLLPKIPKERIIRDLTDLTEIVVYFSESILKIPGVISVITSELASNDVNLIELSGFGPVSQIILLVEDKAALRAYQALDVLRTVK